MIVAPHTVSIVVDGQEVRGWTDYAITSSIMDPVDTFTMSLPWSREAWDLLRPDRSVRVTIDGVTVLRGMLDDRESPGDDDSITVSGRDRIGRLVQESAPAFSYNGQSLTQVIARLADPWFTRVTLSNARNRRVLRGKGHKAEAGAEPIIVEPRADGMLAEPGQTRWAIIEELLSQAGLMAWSAGDGTELIVGLPNYGQSPQWRFFRPRPGSLRASEGNASIGVRDSTADRYSQVIVVGSGRGTRTNYGAAVASRRGEALDSPHSADGTGEDFTYAKRLVIHSPVQSTREATAMAERELRRRRAQGEVITVSVPWHGQVSGGVYRTIYTPDTMANLECERTGRRGAYLVTSCKYTSRRGDGERTDMELVPRGAELAQ